MRDIKETLEALAKDEFRARFKLRGHELAYLHEKGLDTVIEHARDLLSKRLAPAVIPNDGKQTPWRNHPVFVAQHGTGTCCRGCLKKWHHIPKGRAITDEELEHVLSVLRAWMSQFLTDEHPLEPKAQPPRREEPVQLNIQLP